MKSPLLPVLLLLVSCAHRGASPSSDDSWVDPDPSPVVTPAEVPWAEMTEQQKNRYMIRVVTPEMAKTFRAFDAKVFGTFNCETCHGTNPKEKGFKMPSPDLTPLPDSPEVFLATVAKEEPAWVEFMFTKVTPQMAQLLGRKHYDPAAPVEGAFSCNGCHTLKSVPMPN